MSLKFRLSNRQRKELFVRGARLDIALPIPHDESEIPGDLARFAASLVEGLDEARVRQAEWQTILVDPIRGRKTPPPDLTAAIGSIVDSPAALTIRVEVLAVVLAPPKTRSGGSPLQWPANILVDGVPLLAGGDVV